MSTQWLQALQEVMTTGVDRIDRTKVGTRSIFGHQIKFDLRAGFPAVTTKKLMFKAMAAELLWFIEGSRDERRLAEIQYGTRDIEKNTIWTANATADYWLPKAKFERDCGVVYGYNWRHWVAEDGRVIDQIAQLVDGLKNNPFSRRHILMSYNVGEVDNACLPACHCMAQFYVNNQNELSCMVTMRSNDLFLGAPFNYASYALLTHMLAQVCDLKVGSLVHSVGDLHIYHDHFDAVNTVLSRTPYDNPTLELNQEIKNIFDFRMEDMKLVYYTSHPSVTAKMAV